MLVVADSFHGFPKAVAHVQLLIVLGIHDIRRKGQALWIVRDEGGEIPIDHVFKTGPVAVQGMEPVEACAPGAK